MSGFLDFGTSPGLGYQYDWNSAMNRNLQLFQMQQNATDERNKKIAYYAEQMKGGKAFDPYNTLRLQKFYQGLCKLAQGESDPLKLAVELQDKDIKLLLKLLLTWLQDMARYKLVGSETELMNIDCRPFFAKIATLYSLDAIWQYTDHVKMLYSYALASLNLNRQLMLEELLIRWRLHAAS